MLDRLSEVWSADLKEFSLHAHCDPCVSLGEAFPHNHILVPAAKVRHPMSLALEHASFWSASPWGINIMAALARN